MSDIDMKKFLGYRFYKQLSDDEFEILRVVDLNQKDKTRCTAMDESGKNHKIGQEDLKGYTPLEPYGVVTFNLLKLNNKEGERADKDVMVTAHKLIDLKLGLNNNTPFIICRQSVNDFYYDYISHNPTETRMYGFSVSQDTCPTNINMNTLTACSEVLESIMIFVYKDDTVESMITCIPSYIKYNIDKCLKQLHDEYCDSINATPIVKAGKVIHGWCSDLETLMNTNNFMVDFNQMCEITGFDVDLLDWMVLGDDGLYSFNEAARLFFCTVFKVNAVDTKIVKFDYSVNMANFKHDKYTMIRDAKNNIWIVVYLEEGKYLEEELIEQINKLDVTTKLQLAYFNKYAGVM